MNWSSALFLDVFAELRDLVPRSSRRRAIALFGSMTVGSLLEVMGIGILIPLVGFVFSTPGDSVNFFSRLLPDALQDSIAAAAVMAMVCVLIFFAKNLYLAIHTWFEASFAFSINSNLSERLAQRYLVSNYAQMSVRSPAEMVNSISTDVWSVVFTCLLPALTVISELLFSGAIVIFLLYLEPAITLGVVAVVGIASFGFIHVSRRFTADLGVRRQRLEVLKGTQLHQVFYGAREILIYGAGGFFQERLRRSFQSLARAYRDFQLISTLPRFMLEFIAATILIAIISISIAEGQSAQEVLTRVALFTAAGFRLLVAASRLVAGAQSMRFGRASLSRLSTELAGPDRPISPPDHLSAARMPQLEEMTISAVSFAYPGTGRETLSNVSLALHKDSFTGLVGGSGTGKSTFLDLVAGLQRPTSGRLLANGIDVANDLPAWRGSVGYVSQEPILFSDTLRRNIAFGVPDDEINEGMIEQAAKDAQLDELIRTLPGGLDTVIGEGGERFSGGQRQRIAIARALYRRPAVLLLDEPTSALDPETERNILETLIRLRAGRVILIVSHRPSALEDCDQVFRLQSGRLLQGPAFGAAR